ncbi:ABC transporter ATP-binding protein [Halocatena marina]|nr:ABC transporter ATP-binding protein [Halocatena marina]
MATDSIQQETDLSADDSDIRIRIEDLQKTFANGTVIAAENIDLDIEDDDFVVLLGPSGCGKTTTLRCIAGLEEPDSGTIFIDDEDVTYKKPKDHNLAFVFQQIALFPHMSVRRNIRFGLDMNTDLSSKEKRERVEEVADLLGIRDLLDRSPSALSGGQQQRVSLGRAMVMEPAAFLLDEPFSALDANLRDQMQTEIKKLHQSLGTAMVFVTHDQEEAMTLGNKIVVMNDGQIQQIGSPYEIYNEPTSKFVAEFIGSPSTNMFDCMVQAGKEGVTLRSDTFELHLDERRADAFDGMDGNSVTLGIRPEYLEVDASDPLFEATVDVIEPQGKSDAVHLSVGDVGIVASVTQGRIGRNRERTSIAFDRDELWVFDESGSRLL